MLQRLLHLLAAAVLLAPILMPLPLSVQVAPQVIMPSPKPHFASGVMQAITLRVVDLRHALFVHSEHILPEESVHAPIAQQVTTPTQKACRCVWLARAGSIRRPHQQIVQTALLELILQLLLPLVLLVLVAHIQHPAPAFAAVAQLAPTPRPWLNAQLVGLGHTHLQVLPIALLVVLEHMCQALGTPGVPLVLLGLSPTPQQPQLAWVVVLAHTVLTLHPLNALRVQRVNMRLPLLWLSATTVPPITIPTAQPRFAPCASVERTRSVEIKTAPTVLLARLRSRDWHAVIVMLDTIRWVEIPRALLVTLENFQPVARRLVPSVQLAIIRSRPVRPVTHVLLVSILLQVPLYAPIAMLATLLSWDHLSALPVELGLTLSMKKPRAQIALLELTPTQWGVLSALIVRVETTPLRGCLNAQCVLTEPIRKLVPRFAPVAQQEHIPTHPDRRASIVMMGIFLPIVLLFALHVQPVNTKMEKLCAALALLELFPGLVLLNARIVMWGHTLDRAPLLVHLASSARMLRALDSLPVGTVPPASMDHRQGWPFALLVPKGHSHPLLATPPAQIALQGSTRAPPASRLAALACLENIQVRAPLIVLLVRLGPPPWSALAALLVQLARAVPILHQQRLLALLALLDTIREPLPLFAQPVRAGKSPSLQDPQPVLLVVLGTTTAPVEEVSVLLVQPEGIPVLVHLRAPIVWLGKLPVFKPPQLAQIVLREPTSRELVG
jgi:hypothetical protein